jgi:hypothetical protein
MGKNDASWKGRRGGAENQDANETNYYEYACCMNDNLHPGGKDPFR